MKPDTSGDPQTGASSDNGVEAATPKRKQPSATPSNADGAQPELATVSADAPAAPPRTTQRAPRKAATTTTKATVQDTPPPPATALIQETHTRTGSISPANAVFVSVCFEGPDIYSTAGGLGTRVTELCESLAMQGYETHLIFVGDPAKPARETLVDGKLHLERWGQWISKYYPNGVYDGEEQKLYDYSQSVPPYICEQIVRPAVEEGKIVIIIGEDWHTAETICRTSDLLYERNLRHRAVLMWNCNSLMSLHRINWGRLNYASTITTVSRYMKHRLWQYNVNPLVIPNGIPARYLTPPEEGLTNELREVMKRGDPDRLFLFKIGRFDPDKRWIMAIEAAAHLKYSGHPVAMAIRGGIEPHGVEALSRARHLGLQVKDVEAKRPTVEECVQLLRDAGPADIYNLRFFVPAEFVRLCYASADAVLANSGHEPFGLVGLEVMAAGGIAFTGSTGEDYVLSFENAIALETEDPDEIVGYLLHLKRDTEEREKIRAAGRRTAAEFTWNEAIENLNGKLDYLARKQGIYLE